MMASNNESAGQQQPAPVLYQCIDCQESLPRGSFSKKVFASDEKTCRSCRQAATALRTKQPVATQTKLGRRAESGQHRRPNNFGYCHYVDQLFAKACFADIAALRVFNSAKDVSESMAALQGALKHGNMFKGGKAGSTNNDANSKMLCLCIGDGATPRTAVMCAYLQRNWTCVSIDPALRDEWHGDEAPQDVQGLVGVKGTLEEFLLQPPSSILHQEYSSILILCVHSHARFVAPHCTVPQIRQLFSLRPGSTEPLHTYCQSTGSTVPSLQYPSWLLPTTIVSLPCCPKFRHVKDIGVAPQVHYEDDGVFSACRKVEVWNFV